MSAAVRFTRVVLGCSGEAESLRFAALAADLARSFDAELSGLFVEDETVFSLADLPFSLEIAMAGSARPMGRSELEAAYRAKSYSARARMEEAARQAVVRFSYATERGAVRSIVERTARSGDIVVFVEPEHAIDRVCIVNTGFLSAAIGSSGALLYVPANARRWAGGVAACLSGTADREVLDAALRVAATHARHLKVLAPEGKDWRALLADLAADPASPGQPSADIGARSDRIEEGRFSGDARTALARISAEHADDLLVAARERSWITTPQVMRALAAGRRAPILLIEPGPEA